MSLKGVSRLSTIGETLRSAREEQGKSIAEAATATRIRSSYIEALEQERFDELGGSVYAKGFLRSYASFLGLDPEPLLETYHASQPGDRPAFERPPKILGTMQARHRSPSWVTIGIVGAAVVLRSEEHTSELQSPYDIVSRLLLEKKKKIRYILPATPTQPTDQTKKPIKNRP